MRSIEEALSTALPNQFLYQLQDGLIMRLSKSAMVDLRQAIDPPTILKEQHHERYVLKDPQWLNASLIESHNGPYPHTIISPVFDAAVADELLSFLEGLNNWRTMEDHYYSLRTVELLDQKLPDELAVVFSRDRLRGLEQDMSSIFSANLRLVGRITVLLLEEGQGLGVHSDGNVAGHYRMAVTLSRSAAVHDGGHFVVLSSEDGHGAEEIIWRRHNCGIVISLLPYSYHAVTNIRSVPRFSVVFTFENFSKPQSPNQGEERAPPHSD
ncbi:MAG TPA: hypothetical protein VE054_01275 [Blattabacteriaceae bacterium]|nr:hypothetical protein [Blattabacteriaceae bacterium]